MRFFTYTLFFLFSLSIVGKLNFIAFIKKIKSPIELTSANELEEDGERGVDDDENKERPEKEVLEEKNPYYLESYFHYVITAPYNCNKNQLDFYKLLFKSHFKKVATPPPELV